MTDFGSKKRAFQAMLKKMLAENVRDRAQTCAAVQKLLDDLDEADDGDVSEGNENGVGDNEEHSSASEEENVATINPAPRFAAQQAYQVAKEQFIIVQRCTSDRTPLKRLLRCATSKRRPRTLQTLSQRSLGNDDSELNACLLQSVNLSHGKMQTCTGSRLRTVYQ